MSLTDMRLTKAESKKDSKETVSSAGEKRKYPYGLNISLEKESLNKLNLDLRNFKITDQAMILCQVEVTRISQSNEYEPDERSLSFQIQKMAVRKPGKKYALDWDASGKNVDEQLKKDGLIA